MPLVPLDRPQLKEKSENSQGLKFRIQGQSLPDSIGKLRKEVIFKDKQPIYLKNSFFRFIF